MPSTAIERPFASGGASFASSIHTMFSKERVESWHARCRSHVQAFGTRIGSAPCSIRRHALSGNSRVEAGHGERLPRSEQRFVPEVAGVHLGVVEDCLSMAVDAHDSVLRTALRSGEVGHGDRRRPVRTPRAASFRAATSLASGSRFRRALGSRLLRTAGSQCAPRSAKAAKPTAFRSAMAFRRPSRRVSSVRSPTRVPRANAAASSPSAAVRRKRGEMRHARRE